MAHHHHHHHHNQQVFVIQVSDNAKSSQLALPSLPMAMLPSEVKYSASLIRGLGYIHLTLGIIVFMLGVLGKWVEPETNWPGAGVWGGLAAITCGFMGLLAYKLWYKNFSIKAFLVASVASVIIQTLAIVLTVYAIINRHEHYHYLMEESKRNPWFRPFLVEEEDHQLSLSIAANQLIGFIFELVLSTWTTYLAWQGARAEEFSSSRRDALLAARDDARSTISRSHNQVPLAALFQLLQGHPEVVANKGNGLIVAPWESDDRHAHQSMDYQERVRRFLTLSPEDPSRTTSCERGVSYISPKRESPVTGRGGQRSDDSRSDETAVMSSGPEAKGSKVKVDYHECTDLSEYSSKTKISSENKTRGRAPVPRQSNSKDDSNKLKRKENSDVIENSEVSKDPNEMVEESAPKALVSTQGKTKTNEETNKTALKEKANKNERSEEKCVTKTGIKENITDAKESTLSTKCESNTSGASQQLHLITDIKSSTEFQERPA